MTKLVAGAALAVTLVSLAGPAAADRPSPAEKAVHAIAGAMKAGDCASAAELLNDGIARKYPEVYLVAGSMFENGVCLKRDWSRAKRLYIMAYDGGQRAAGYRLAAGFAAPENGPDSSSALWWANREKHFGFKNCAVSAEVNNDPERFRAELRTWTQARLEACNYLVGVMTTMGGEFRYPLKATRYRREGAFVLRFEPAVPRFAIRTAEASEFEPLGVLDGSEPVALKNDRGGFANELRQTAERALKRYPQPPDIPADWYGDFQFNFYIP